LGGGNDGKERNTYPPHTNTPTKRQRGNCFIKSLFVYSGIIRNREMMEIDYYDEIEKLRVLSNEGKITGDEFLDKFFLLRSCLIKE
jgi:hypothetical protein